MNSQDADQVVGFDSASLLFVESLYEKFLEAPESVPESWRGYFSSLEGHAGANGSYVSHREVQQEIVRHVKYDPPMIRKTSDSEAEWVSKQAAVLNLINAYRLYGHLRADIDPLGQRQSPHVAQLDLETHGLTTRDLGRLFHTGTMPAPNELPLHDILQRLENTYCSHIAVEYMHIANEEEKRFFQERVESTQCDPDFTLDEKKHILKMMTAAEGMERYLHTKYSGQKRFSVEGGESLIPVLDTIIQDGGASGVQEFVVGMAHRGRLNVLVNIFGKQPKSLFDEFEKGAVLLGDKMTGDVKYHQGYSTDLSTPGGPVHLALAFNPSHLEIINPVVEGSSRARQDRRGDHERGRVVPILIHGDAALAGQGVVYETLALSQTRAYSTGGSIHIVINNQVGFTTSNPNDARSSTYCTDVAKVGDCPVFHVNGDDPEACVFVAKLAIDFRMRFKRDVFIDLVCYRRHGHNEGDPPSATQPNMYKTIKEQETTLTQYRNRLVQRGRISEAEALAMASDYRDALDRGESVNPRILPDYNYPYLSNWSQHLDVHWAEKVQTGMSKKHIQRLGTLACHIPERYNLHPSVRKIMEDRQSMMAGKIPLDWGCAETLAYASLLEQGYPVRMTGQDCCRGTFFHRHAVVHDMDTGDTYCALQYIDPDQPQFTIYDSVLSEAAVLGFEYGYSATTPGSLVIWEAQYGDFVNNAQVVIDQFISSSEQKWHLLSGLVMLLPHGWEGQGPEHSSARLERFLQLCAQDNMSVCVPSTPAQMFHMLRRQVLRKVRMPLIVMTPKSMLRVKDSFSSLEDLNTKGSFQMVIGDVDTPDPSKVTRISICSGRIYYELLRTKREEGIENVALMRLEQLYPFPDVEVAAEFAKYPNVTEIFWTQEEPRNQGAWYQIDHQLRRLLQPHQKLRYAGRIPCSAPAGGSKVRHDERERLLIEASLGLRDDQTGEESTKRVRPSR